MTDTLDTTLDTDLPLGCGCAACRAGQDSDTSTVYEGSSTYTSDYAALSGDLEAASSVTNANTLIDGREWGEGGGVGVEVTFSFPTSVPSYYASGATESTNFQAFTAEMQNAARAIFDMLETFTNLTFTEVSGEAGDITLAQAQLDSGVGAWAYYPDQGSYGGDVWTNNLYASSTQDVALGNYGFYTLMHEIGHALGLQHTFDAGLSGAENTEQYSVMAYDWSPWGSLYAQTYMIYDIAALQTIYGANTDYNTGDDTYILAANVAQSIWDGGGTDTLDASAVGSDVTLDLTAGSFSSVGLTSNVSIAYGVTIENATTGAGADTITTNAADNTVLAGAGNDTIYGSSGNDVLNGEGGTGDVVNYSYDLSDFIFNFIDATTLSLSHLLDGWSDTLINIESYIFNGVTYDRTGLEQNGLTSFEEISTRFEWNGGADRYTYRSDSLEDRSISGPDIGYDGYRGDFVTFSRSVTGLDITFLTTTAPSVVKLYGSASDDVITISGTVTDYSSIVYLGEGNDTLTVNVAGANTLYGHGGDDTITGAAGSDKIYGGDGLDSLDGSDGDDWLWGDGGDDSLLGGAGFDALYGGDGADTLSGGADDDVLDGGADNDTLYGGFGDDMLYGQDGADTLYGEDGWDILYGHGGDDTLNGGDGNDKLFGLDDNDTLSGDAGDDILYGGLGTDTLSGGDDNDTLYGEEGADILSGDAGDDRLYGGDDNDVLDGGVGDDFLAGELGDDVLSGGDGNDYLYGHEGADVLNGDLGNDRLYGHSGDDVLNGGDGDDKLFGLEDNDSLNGGAGTDTLYGGTGLDTLSGGDDNDRLYGEDGNDILYGDAGNDVLYAGLGDDRLEGGTGDDYLYGHEDADVLLGDDGVDRLYGGQDDDMLQGGAGIDFLSGGTGSDTYYYEAMDGSQDRILDFTTGVGGDALNITDILQGFDVGVDDINDFVQLWVYHENRADIRINADGVGDDWVAIAMVREDLSGSTVDDLYADGNLVVDQSIVL